MVAPSSSSVPQMLDSHPTSDLRAEGITVIYNNGHIAIRNISFHLQSGSICALIGVNGSGKSTLFKTIMGFLKPVRGKITINHLPIKTARRHKLIAYVPQSEEVDWSFPVSVKDVVLMGRYGFMNFLRIPRAEDHRIVKESMERVGIWGLRDRQIGELSGGQKKRTFLARALAQKGQIILLDEPFTGVDTTTESEIIALLKALRETGHIILVSTHDLASVPKFCDSAVVINVSVLASGPLETTFTRDILTAAFGEELRKLPIEIQTGRTPQSQDDIEFSRNIPATQKGAL